MFSNDNTGIIVTAMISLIGLSLRTFNHWLLFLEIKVLFILLDNGGKDFVFDVGEGRSNLVIFLGGIIHKICLINFNLDLFNQLKFENIDLCKHISEFFFDVVVKVCLLVGIFRYS